MNLFALVTTAASVGILLSGCDVGCANEEISAQASPSGNYQVVVFNRNCGATTRANTQVSIVKAGSPVSNEAGNALILDGTVPLSVRWLSETKVSIKGAGGAKGFKREPSAAGVEVAYE